MPGPAAGWVVPEAVSEMGTRLQEVCWVCPRVERLREGTAGLSSGHAELSATMGSADLQGPTGVSSRKGSGSSHHQVSTAWGPPLPPTGNGEMGRGSELPV